MPLLLVVENLVTVGSTVSIVTESADELPELTPPEVVCFETIDHTPSASVPRLQLVPLFDAVNVHDTSAVPAFDAVTVTVFPELAPVTVMVGVSIFVMLSEFDSPESEADARSGVVGADNAVTVIVMVDVVR